MLNFLQKNRQNDSTIYPRMGNGRENTYVYFQITPYLCPALRTWMWGLSGFTAQR